MVQDTIIIRDYAEPITYTPPSSLSCALGIITDSTGAELTRIKDIITIGLLQDIRRIKRAPTGNTDLDYVRNAVDEYMIAEVSHDRTKMLKRIVGQQTYTNPMPGRVTDMMIERAKEKPIEELIDTQVFSSSGKWVGCASCPLPDHQGERTPSFYIDKNNRYKCFGCGGAGSAIDLYMVLNGKTFIQAVREMQK